MSIENILAVAAFFCGAISSLIAANSMFNAKIKNLRQEVKKEIITYCDLKYACKEDITEIRLTLAEIKKDIETVLKFIATFEEASHSDSRPRK